ncbi:restriction endonuclease subunit S [Methanobrevibacter intestini]|uniref:restriction endonuclease subunit S n=1 Tax=Methanobrevibacter intestini TaxID=2911853 RepID=UPI003CFD76D2
MSFSKNTFTNIFGEISSEFNVYTIEDIASDEKRSIISGPFGSNISSKYFTEHGVPVIRGNNLTEDNTKFIDEGFVFVSEEKAKELNTYADVDDLVFTAAGTIGQVGIIPENSKFDRYVISNKQLRVTLDLNKVNQHYAYYWFSSKLINKYIKQLNTGSTIPLINLTILKGLPIPLPSKDLQDKIANIIINIDKKIEINKKINKNLEEQLSLLFNDWFVNCTPFKNEELIKSEWDVVPESWKDIEFGELIEITSGNRPDEKSEDKTSEFNIPLFGASKIMGYTKEYSYNEDILIIGRVGTHGVVQRVNYPCFPSDNTFVIKSDYYGFVYQLLKRIDYDSLNTGSTQPLITQKSLKSVNTILPDEKILSKFEMISKTIFDKIQLNNDEISKLTKLRDTLLPKLMSGEIDVSKINCDLELKYNYMKYLFNQIHTPMSKSVV